MTEQKELRLQLKYQEDFWSLELQNIYGLERVETTDVNRTYGILKKILTRFSSESTPLQIPAKCCGNCEHYVEKSVHSDVHLTVTRWINCEIIYPDKLPPWGYCPSWKACRADKIERRYGLYRLGVYSNKIEKEQAYKRYLNPLEAYECHDNGLSVLLEDRHMNKNWYFIKDFKCVVEKKEKE